MRFRDRTHAGRLLGDRLAQLGLEAPIVVGLARGGVPVAAEVARILGAPLDVLVVRKLGCPWQPELGVGAIAEGGSIVFDTPLLRRLGLSEAELDDVVRRETAQLEARMLAYHRGRPHLPWARRIVVLVDDGVATGYTIRAAVDAVRRADAAHIVVAVPVGAAESVASLREVADDVVCLTTPASFLSVGDQYDTFTQVPDAEVEALARRADGASGSSADEGGSSRALAIAVGTRRLPGDLVIPGGALGTVVFAHGSGSSRLSPRNRAVAASLNRAGLATLLFDLLGPDEAADRRLVFDVELLAGRLELALACIGDEPDLRALPVGLFGASTGAAAALVAAADAGPRIAAVVSRGGRPDLAGTRLGEVRAPTLLIVGGRDEVVLELNRQAQERLRCDNSLQVVPGATHLFEEPGALEEVARLAAEWFSAAFRSTTAPAGQGR
jgi:putative phosphoribosyl transferase